MPTTLTNDKIEIKLYLPYETFRAMEDSRNPKMPRSAYCSMLLQELFS